MKIIDIKMSNDKCFLLHSWVTLKDNRFTKYQICKKCKSKRILQQVGGYQPINRNFLYIEE